MGVDFNQVRELFLAAVERHSQEEREAYLDEACAGDDALRREVAELLKAHGEGVTPADDPTRIHESARGGASEVIGPYKLLEPIGEGGMGSVWMAQQTEPVRRKVAVKLIKAGMDSKQVVARFEAERQALALMDHPNIAKVLDAGVVGPASRAGLPVGPARLAGPTGAPYFVMELVKGVPITRYSDEARLTPRQRLALFLPVCAAVQHAHQKGVIHRDLKPSNVLVALYDGKPVPKVIDFGVAKATGADLTDKTLFTGYGAVVGTLEYMSPEQAELNNLDVDTRSDVYALGVLLYELLTGATPLDRKRLKAAPLLEALRLIREEEAVPPSTRLSTARELPAWATGRGELLRGEIDWIVMKALEKERDRRYESPGALARDVERYLRDEPVQACPPTVGYRLRKFVRRNQLVLSAAAAVTLALVLGTVVSVWQALRATAALGLADQRLVAEEEARQEAQRRLYDARLAQVRASRWSRQVGQREGGLWAVREAVQVSHELDLGEKALQELRDEAIACLALTDARLVQPAWPGFPTGSTGKPAFDADLEHYACGDEQGNLSVRRVADDQELARLPGQGQGNGRGAATIAFSPDGRLLAVCHWLPISGSRTNFRLWDWRAGRVVFEPPFSLAIGAHSFTPDGQHILLGQLGGAITTHECGNGKEVRRWNAGLKPFALTPHPDGARLAVTEYMGRTIRIFDLATGAPLQAFETAAHLRGVDWHPDGSSLAAVDNAARVYCWEVAPGRSSAPRLPGGHRADVAFVAGGRLLVSHSDVGASRVWDLWAGQELLHLPGHVRAVSRDGTRVVVQEETRLLHWKLLPSSALLTMPRIKADEADFVNDAAFSPDGRWLLGSGQRGLWVWDLAGEGMGRLVPLARTSGGRFHPRREEVFTSGEAGLYRWPARATPTALHLGPPVRLLSGLPSRIGLDREGRRLTALLGGGGARTLDLDAPAARPVTMPHVNAAFVASSPDGKWVATGTQHGEGVKLWDARTGQERRHLLRYEKWASVAFSPDSRWLVTGTPTAVAVWDVATGSLIREMRREQQGSLPGAAFSPDGKLLAVNLRLGEVQLIDPTSWQPVARLLGPDTSPVEAGSLGFSPDGTLLAVATLGGDLRLWDLHRLRGRLGELGLDWDHPAYPPPRHAGAPCQVRVDLGDFPRNARLRGHLAGARAHAAAKRWREAVVEYDRAVELAPAEAALLDNRAHAREQLDEFDLALRDRAKAVELNGSNPRYLNNLAWQLATCPREDLRDARRAVALAQRAVLLRPAEATYWNTLGTAYYRVGQWPRAVEALERSVRKQGDNGWDGFFLAMAHHQLGANDRARQWYDKAVAWMDKHRPKDAELRRFRAEAESLLGGSR